MPLLESRGSSSAFSYGLNAGELTYAGIPGLFANYTASSWDGSIWYDISGKGNHATEIWQGGNIVKSTSYSNESGVNKSFTTLHANANGGIRFPQSLDLNANYTLFHITRRYGNTSGGDSQNRGRIFDGLGDNWLSGFWNGASGVAYHNGWLTQSSSDIHGNNWVLSTDQLSLYRSNGVNRVNGLNGPVATTTQLSLHNGNYTNGGSERSTWVCAEVVFFNRELSSAEYVTVENFLKTKYGFTY